MILSVIAAWYLVLSLMTLILYAVDKRRATAGAWRIKENTVHLLELLGGWPGGLAAQLIFHHKTRKPSFQLAFWAIVILHLAGWGLLIHRWCQ
jgi:uncharacterized membrane protein YsdA (DUF1294 family)